MYYVNFWRIFQVSVPTYHQRIHSMVSLIVSYFLSEPYRYWYNSLIFFKNIWIIHEKYSMINRHLGNADVVEWQTRYFEGVVSHNWIYARVVEWQTRSFEGAVNVCSWGFKSLLLHQFIFGSPLFKGFFSYLQSII